MKRVVNIPRKYTVLLIAFFAVALLGATIFFTKNSSDYQDEMDALTDRKVEGRIIDMRDIQRGSYSLDIKTSSGDTLRISGLPIAWDIDQYHLQVGDSVAKAPYGRTLLFYTLKDGKYQLLFTHKL